MKDSLMVQKQKNEENKIIESLFQEDQELKLKLAS